MIPQPIQSEEVHGQIEIPWLSVIRIKGLKAIWPPEKYFSFETLQKLNAFLISIKKKFHTKKVYRIRIRRGQNIPFILSSILKSLLVHNKTSEEHVIFFPQIEAD